MSNTNKGEENLVQGEETRDGMKGGLIRGIETKVHKTGKGVVWFHNNGIGGGIHCSSKNKEKKK